MPAEEQDRLDSEAELARRRQTLKVGGECDVCGTPFSLDVGVEVTEPHDEEGGR